MRKRERVERPAPQHGPDARRLASLAEEITYLAEQMHQTTVELRRELRLHHGQ